MDRRKDYENVIVKVAVCITFFMAIVSVIVTISDLVYLATCNCSQEEAFDG